MRFLGVIPIVNEMQAISFEPVEEIGSYITRFDIDTYFKFGAVYPIVFHAMIIARNLFLRESQNVC